MNRVRAGRREARLIHAKNHLVPPSQHTAVTLIMGRRTELCLLFFCVLSSPCLVRFTWFALVCCFLWHTWWWGVSRASVFHNFQGQAWFWSRCDLWSLVSDFRQRSSVCDSFARLDVASVNCFVHAVVMSATSPSLPAAGHIGRDCCLNRGMCSSRHMHTKIRTTR